MVAELPYCHNCGADIRPGVKFCPNCGAAQEEGVVASKPTSTEKPPGRPRPALATVFIIGYLGLGIVLVFLGAYSLLFSTQFPLGVLAFALIIFLGDGVLSLLTVYGFLKGGRLAKRYIAVTSAYSVVVGLLLSLTYSAGLVILGVIAILLGAGALVYLWKGNVREFLKPLSPG